MIYILFFDSISGNTERRFYKYFANNFGYYALTINYEEDEFIKNEDGYGVLAQNNKCYDKFNCTIIQFREKANVNLEKFLEIIIFSLSKFFIHHLIQYI